MIRNIGLIFLIISFVSLDASFAHAQVPDLKARTEALKAAAAKTKRPDSKNAKDDKAANPLDVKPVTYLGNLSEEEYNKFFLGSFLYSSVERALIQKAVLGKVEEPEKNLAQEQKQKEILDPEDFQVEKRTRTTPVKSIMDDPIGALIHPTKILDNKPKVETVTKKVYKPKTPEPQRNFAIQQNQQTTVKPVVPAERLISLAGILYRGVNDWVVWLNGQKVTPGNLLPEIIEIKVENSSYVRLKWYDIGLQEVISITLRPNQTYDITTGILLPG